MKSKDGGVQVVQGSAEIVVECLEGLSFRVANLEATHNKLEALRGEIDGIGAKLATTEGQDDGLAPLR
jgi:hypothetical protein